MSICKDFRLNFGMMRQNIRDGESSCGVSRTLSTFQRRSGRGRRRVQGDWQSAFGKCQKCPKRLPKGGAVQMQIATYSKQERVQSWKVLGQCLTNKAFHRSFG
ncbi:hypothetical protein M758_UG257200 [Ceratodon purpureus]|nr:hypothetical protein M758_UG257200 [Ceratodon purpureus]